MTDSNLLNEVARIIDDPGPGYSITLERLCEGVATYSLVYNDEPAIDFSSHAEALDHVKQRRTEAKASQVLVLVEGWSNSAQSQPCAEAGTHIPPSPYTPSLLDRAIYIAAGAHSGMIDKAGAPYIHHVLRVMQAMESIEARVVAVLYDVLEDCPDWTPHRLANEGIPFPLVVAVQTLTRGSDESYDTFIARVAQNPLAAEVKRADLMDNMDLTRIANPGRGDYARQAKYERALKTLSDPAASPAEQSVLPRDTEKSSPPVAP